MNNRHVVGCNTERRGCVPGCDNYDPKYDYKEGDGTIIADLYAKARALEDTAKRLHSVGAATQRFIEALKDEMPDGLECANEWVALEANLAITRRAVDAALAKAPATKNAPAARYRVKKADVAKRYNAGEIGVELLNDFPEKYDHKIDLGDKPLPHDEAAMLAPMLGGHMIERFNRVFYFHADEVERVVDERATT